MCLPRPFAGVKQEVFPDAIQITGRALSSTSVTGVGRELRSREAGVPCQRATPSTLGNSLCFGQLPLLWRTLSACDNSLCFSQLSLLSQALSAFTNSLCLCNSLCFHKLSLLSQTLSAFTNSPCCHKVCLVSQIPSLCFHKLSLESQTLSAFTNSLRSCKDLGMTCCL